MRIMHFSDLHEEGSFEAWGAFLDKRLFGVLNCKLGRRRLHSPSLTELAASFILKEGPDAVVCTGDLSTCGQPGEFKRALARLQPLLDSAIPIIYVPGNHDAYVRDRACRRALEDAFAAVNKGRFKLRELPQAFDIGDCRFIAIDCARPANPFLACGFMDAKTSEFIKAECASPKGKPRILVGHFPVLERHPLRQARRKLYGCGDVRELLKSGALDLSLCGHVHSPYALLGQDGRGEACAGSVTRWGKLSAIEYDKSAGKFAHRRHDLWNEMESAGGRKSSMRPAAPLPGPRSGAACNAPGQEIFVTQTRRDAHA